jgi:hypothetical protein
VFQKRLKRAQVEAFFALAAAALAFPGSDLKPVLEPGEFLFLAGQSADPRELLSIKLRALPD